MENKTALQNRLHALFPAFDQTELIRELVEKGKYLEAPAGMQLLQTGSEITQIPLVLSGTVKVFREEEGGGEVLLYYIKGGESCAMTLSSFHRRERSQVRAVVHESAELLVIPSHLAQFIYRQYPSWQTFTMETFRVRFDEMMNLVDQVVFKQLDERLFTYLIQRSEAKNKRVLLLSHREIAEDLSSSREVISRLLKQMERNGWVKLGRGRIEILREE